MSIQLIIGSMFSGKSTELLRRIKRLQSIGMRCLLINHSTDHRSGGAYIQTHDQTRVEAKKTDDLLLVDFKGYDAIAIDEAQFFPNLKTAVLLMAETHGKYVILAGLNGDYQRRPFGEIVELVPYADEITLTRAYCAVCKDGTLASFTKRHSHESETVCIGGSEKYIPVCRKHYV